jgi:hypothetical protein
MRPALQRSAACALQQQRSRHALDVRDFLALARFGDSSMRWRVNGRLPVRCNSSARATLLTCAPGWC